MTPFDPKDLPTGSVAGHIEGRFRYVRAGACLWHFPLAPGAGVPIGHLEQIQSPGDVSLRRLAQAIRQDLWRVLQRERGFWPVIRLCRDEQRIDAMAGGLVPRIAPHLAQRIAALFTETRVAGWMTHAQAAPKHAKRGGRRPCSARF